MPGLSFSLPSEMRRRNTFSFLFVWVLVIMVEFFSHTQNIIVFVKTLRHDRFEFYRVPPERKTPT